MGYLIAFTLLVALGAWVVSSYLRLIHLYERVQGAWLQWTRATQQRNECLRQFVTEFRAGLPLEAELFSDMHRRELDSCRVLKAFPYAPREGDFGSIAEAERYLRRAVSYSVHTVETAGSLQHNQQLTSLCSAMSVSMYRQDEQMLLYKRFAVEYNTALYSPGARIVAGVFGFSPVAVGR